LFDILSFLIEPYFGSGSYPVILDELLGGGRAPAFH
jgi:hypothetical protein